jgi:type I restriction enzyme S subunit
MAASWQRIRLGDVVKIAHGWPFKSECFTEQRAGRPIVVNIGNFQYTGGFRFESTTVKEYTADYPKEYELSPRDILLVMTCQTSGGEILGIPGRIPDDGKTYLHNQRMGKVVIKEPKRVDSDFVYYLALWSDFNRELYISASGTKILHTAPVRIEAFEFNIPPLAEQKAIAAVLGTLDDKIELNRRMNGTLEAVARTLFQSWFVDFLPVRANMDAKADDSASGLPPAEPSSWFVYAMECGDGSIYIGQTEDLRQRWLQHIGGRGGRWTKGHTPMRVAYWETQSSREAAVEREKWLKTGFGRKWLKKEIAARTQTGDPVRAKLDGRQPAALDPATAALFPNEFEDSELGHIPKGWTVGKVGDLCTLSRTALNPADFPTETFDHFSLPAFDEGRTPKPELGSAIMSNKLVVTPNCVLLSKLNPHIPRIWLPDLHPTRRSVCSTEFIVACSKPGVSREHLFSLFTSSAFASVYGTLVTGTTGSHQRIRSESVLGMQIVIPPSALIRAFTDLAKPLFDRINRNTEQSRTLATVRDTLLPKLLSGELAVQRQ